MHMAGPQAPVGEDPIRGAEDLSLEVVEVLLRWLTNTSVYADVQARFLPFSDGYSGR